MEILKKSIGVILTTITVLVLPVCIDLFYSTYEKKDTLLQNTQGIDGVTQNVQEHNIEVVETSAPTNDENNAVELVHIQG